MFFALDIKGTDLNILPWMWFANTNWAFAMEIWHPKTKFKVNLSTYIKHCIFQFVVKVLLAVVTTIFIVAKLPEWNSLMHFLALAIWFIVKLSIMRYITLYCIHPDGFKNPRKIILVFSTQKVTYQWPPERGF